MFSAAQKDPRASRSAPPPQVPGGDTFASPDVTQGKHIEGSCRSAPAGGAVSHPISARREYNPGPPRADQHEQVEGLKKPNDVEVLLDRERIALATSTRPAATKRGDRRRAPEVSRRGAGGPARTRRHVHQGFRR